METKCRWCGTQLQRELHGYPHVAGWHIEGRDGTWWLYIVCPKCGYQWALWKLGVPRDVVIKPEEWILVLEERR